MHDYLLNGYAENRRSLELQGKTIGIQSRIISPATNTEEKELLEVIDSYSKALNILDDYDHQCLEKPKGNKGYIRFEYEECINLIAFMRFSLTSNLFGREKSEGALLGIIYNVYQSVYEIDIYNTI